MTAIYKRELSSYFNSMIGYVFIAVLVFFTGIYFMAYNLYSGLPQFSYTLYSLMTILMFAIPLLTMKSMAEERRSRTDQLLLTAPVSLTGVVMGKFLAMATIFLIPVALCAFCPLIIAHERGGPAFVRLRRPAGFLPHGLRVHRHRHVPLLSDGEPDHRRREHLRRTAGALSLGRPW